MSFPPFRLDAGEAQLWKGTKLVAVRRKPFAILSYLATNPKRLVTHEELLKHIWSGAAVSESAVRSHLHELRQVLGDGVIETVVGRGYRFTADIVSEPTSSHGATRTAAALDAHVVGRADELAALRKALARAREGQRQMCFVTGEPGIGKTTLVDAFLAELDAAGILAVRGHNVEQHGTPEAYRSVIEVLSALRQSERGDDVLAALVRNAPTFLAQLPHLIPDAQIAEVERRAATGNEARMVRELIEALEVMSMQEPLVVVLEDLQWSDLATIDLLSALGQRRERAKLFVIATSRRSEAQTVTHPLNRVMRTLVSRSGAISIPLDRIDTTEIRALLDTRFPGHAFPAALLEIIEKITGGTPLFLTALLDDLQGRGMLALHDGAWSLTASIAEVAAHRPDNVRQLIDIQLDRLTPEEQRILEAASLIGIEFPTALAAAALEISVEQADELCDSLARRALFLRHEGTEDWPDGSQQSRYGVTHGLVQEVCVERAAPARRQRWHRRIAERLELAYGLRAPEIASTLAVHFEHAQMVARAMHFHTLAAERVSQRFASVAALPSYRRALHLVTRLPESPERDTEELRILGGMASSVLRNRFEKGESVAQFERMITLAKKLGDTPKLCAAVGGLSVRLSTLARYDEAHAIGAELSETVATLDPVFSASANAARALPLFWRGQVALAIELLESLTHPEAPIEENIGIGILDPAARKTVLMSYLGVSYWLRGAPDAGLREMRRSLTEAQGTGDPYAVGLTTVNLARVLLLRRAPPTEIRSLAQPLLANHDADIWHLQATMVLRWAESHDAPLTAATADQMMEMFRERVGMFPMGTTYLAIPLVDALRRSRLFPAAMTMVDHSLAFARRHGERVFESELVRLRGQIIEDETPAAAAAEPIFREALAVAEAASCWMPALRAALRLVRFDGVARLTGLLAHITDGFDTPDVAEARQLVAS